MGKGESRRVLKEPSEVEVERDSQHELDFLRGRIRALARGRFADEQEDVATDAWIRLDRALRREMARNLEAMMTHIAGRAWIDFCRRKMSEGRALGTRVPVEAAETEAVSQDRGVDPDALRFWRFAVFEWFSQHSPGCLEPARQVFAGRTWVQAAQELQIKANSLAKRWQRCREQFLEVVKRDPGDLRALLDYFETVDS